MYYSDFARIQRMEGWLERLAYASVFLDVMVAGATYMVTRGAQYSATMLLWSGYLLAAEVVIAAFIFVSLIALKHYRKIIESVALSTFRTRYPSRSSQFDLLDIVKKIAAIPIRVVLFVFG